jgi:hypothetical protein
VGFLYINSKGKPWRKHSYSAGNTFDQSPKKYYLQKILGWREKDNKGRFAFGKALETAVQHHHENNGEGAIKRFTQEWEQYRNNTNLQYTKVEGDWQKLLKTGIEMIRLYIIRQPSLPIPMGGQTVFQREYAKEVFPGDPVYGEIEDAGKLDIVAFVEPTHPSLAKLNWKPEYGPFRPVVVDIKTAGADFPEANGKAAYDLQLRRYSWLSDIRDVALLWFVKKGHSFQKGSSVTLLENAGIFKAGQEAVVAQVDGEDLILVANDFMVEEMTRAQGKKGDKTDQTNAAKERRDKWLEQFGARVPAEIVTKQRLQFNSGFVEIESANEAGVIAANQIVNIVNAWQRHLKTQNGYPNGFGVRYPHDDSNDPYYKAFIEKGGDENYRNLNFTKSDEESITDLFAETDTEEAA